MAKDSQHQTLNYRPNEIAHGYGENVHILSDPYLLALLAKLCHPQTFQPLINQYVEKIYSLLFSTMVNLCFPYKLITTDTRMIAHHPEGVYEGQVLADDFPVVCVDLARAGTWPSHLCYHACNFLFPPQLVRQDHFYVNRKVDENGKVVGIDMSGAKIGGGIDQAFVIIPDPMGATGSTLSHVLHHYKNKKLIPGTAQKFVALHLIITPEYIKRMKKDHPDLVIISARLDRGLSSPEVLKTKPGTLRDQERGLNDHHYIVPGGGGLGEVLNNSFV